jgi:hypothetical protein
VPPPRPRNIVVILTDDQRFDSLWAMPILFDRLRTRGVNFTNAMVTTPLCCPFRAAFLSGGYYAHDTGVHTNSPPDGGFVSFDDSDSLALRPQQQAGYATSSSDLARQSGGCRGTSGRCASPCGSPLPAASGPSSAACCSCCAAARRGTARGHGSATS